MREKVKKILFLGILFCVFFSQSNQVEAKMGNTIISGGKRDFQWPVQGHYGISGCFFDEREHYAIDIPAAEGTEVVASYDGTVVEVTINGNKDGGYGNGVMIQHTYNTSTGKKIFLYTRYAHLSSINVENGQIVYKGSTVIGKVGGTGYGESNCYNSHLDFQILTSTAWRQRESCSIDPYANQLLELPSSIKVASTPTCCGVGPTGCCCKTYLDEVKALYTSTSVSTVPTISGANSPGTMNAGETFSIAGTVYSGSELTNVTVGCYDVNGTMKTGKSIDPSGTSYNIKNLDSSINFNQLSPGVYYYRVKATNSKGTATLVEKVFVVLTKEATISSGTYRIVVNSNNNYCVGIANDSTSKDANVELKDTTISGNRTFYIRYIGNGYYTIRNFQSGCYLDVYAQGGSGTNVTQYTVSDTANQKWQILPVGNGYCLVPGCATTTCLDIQSGKISAGSNIQVYTANLTAAQIFNFQSSNGNFNTKNKITFYSEGGTWESIKASYAINGFNIDRESQYLVVFNIPNLEVPTNEWGIEVAVDKTGKVTEVRGYGSTEKLVVPSGGMVISGHLGNGSGGYDFTSKLEVGDYVFCNYSNNKVYAFSTYNRYLASAKYVATGAKYGDLPTLTRDGYTFAGWYIAATGGTKITSSSVYSTNKLYAHWICSTHTYDNGTITTKPTCTSTGVKTYTCTKCGATYTETVAKGAHEYSDEWTIDVEATLTTEGSKSHHCVNCDVKTDVTVIPVIDLSVELTPTATIKYNGHTYALYDLDTDYENIFKNWTAAKAYCESIGGHLVTITSAEEQEAVEELLQSGTTTRYWLGATDAEEEGVWKWVTGETFSYNNWHSNEPNNENSEEHYAEIVARTMLWNDAPEIMYKDGSVCSGFICEFDACEHSWSQWAITKEATYEEDGERLRSCQYCGLEEKEIIPKLVNELLGDADNDGDIDVFDARLVLRYAVEDAEAITTINLENADFDGNGLINVFDARGILQYIVNNN